MVMSQTATQTEFQRQQEALNQPLNLGEVGKALAQVKRERDRVIKSLAHSEYGVRDNIHSLNETIDALVALARLVDAMSEPK